jgi:hypothetical protein
LVLIGIGYIFLVHEKVDGLDGKRVIREGLVHFVDHGPRKLNFDGSEGGDVENEDEYDMEDGLMRFSHSLDKIARLNEIIMKLKSFLFMLFKLQ